jgi:hypothetical protein
MIRMIAVTLAVLALAGCGASSAGPAAPKATQADTPAPAVQRPASAEQIAGRMRLAGRKGYVAYTARTDPNHLLGRQHGYLSKVNWGDRQEVDRWGSIEVFSSPAGAKSRMALLAAISGVLADGYDYRSGSAVLRLGSPYLPAQARRLAAEFRKGV